MITARPERFPLAEVFTISRGAKIHADVVTVEITRDGIMGRGEAVPYGRYGETVDGVLSKILHVSQDITRDELQRALPAGAARNAVDCALWDWEAKAAGTRVWALAGMARPGPAITAFTLSLDAPEAMERAARRHADRPVLKIKLGTEDDVARLAAVHRGAPNARIVVDANEGWTAESYGKILPHLVDNAVMLVEQPLPADADAALADLPRPVPICADESVHVAADLPKLRGKYDAVNIKLDKAGGLSEALALRDAARADGFEIMVGCMVASSLGMAPATLLSEGAMVTDLDGPLLLAEDRDNGLKYDTQGVHPPDAALWG